MALTQYNNRTGHQYVKTATVALSRAGLAEVWADDGSILTLTDKNTLCVSGYCGFGVFLRISARDIAKMERLEQEKERMMLAA